MSKFTTFRFRDFIIYKEAITFRRLINGYVKNLNAKHQYELGNQIHRASLSVILNIAEGSARRSDKEFYRFLEISIASLNEVIAGFDCALDDGFITNIDMANIEKEAESLTRQIGSFMKKLTANS